MRSDEFERMDTSIWSTDAQLQLRHELESEIGGWANDPRPLWLRIVEALTATALGATSAIVALLLAAWIITRST